MKGEGKKREGWEYNGEGGEKNGRVRERDRVREVRKEGRRKIRN